MSEGHGGTRPSCNAFLHGCRIAILPEQNQTHATDLSHSQTGKSRRITFWLGVALVGPAKIITCSNQTANPGIFASPRETTGCGSRSDNFMTTGR